jgi:hypothetical protein
MNSVINFIEKYKDKLTNYKMDDCCCDDRMGDEVTEIGIENMYEEWKRNKHQTTNKELDDDPEFNKYLTEIRNQFVYDNLNETIPINEIINFMQTLSVGLAEIKEYKIKLNTQNRNILMLFKSIEQGIINNIISCKEFIENTNL